VGIKKESGRRHNTGGKGQRGEKKKRGKYDLKGGHVSLSTTNGGTVKQKKQMRKRGLKKGRTQQEKQITTPPV